MNRFFALPLPETIQEELGRLADEWRSLPIGRASWYGSADYHITLKFLGNLDPSRQPELIEAALPVAANAAPFEVDLNAAPGGFPNLRQPRVLWAGVKASPPMAALAGKIDEAMAALGYERERRVYHPHITLARPRSSPLDTPRERAPGGEGVNRGRGERTWTTPKERTFPIFTADRFVLMQTLPLEKPQTKGTIRANPRYNIVRTFPFGLAK